MIISRRQRSSRLNRYGHVPAHPNEQDDSGYADAAPTMCEFHRPELLRSSLTCRAPPRVDYILMIGRVDFVPSSIARPKYPSRHSCVRRGISTFDGCNNVVGVCPICYAKEIPPDATRVDACLTPLIGEDCITSILLPDGQFPGSYHSSGPTVLSYMPHLLRDHAVVRDAWISTDSISVSHEF